MCIVIIWCERNIGASETTTMQPTMETVVKTLRSLLNTEKNGLLDRHLRRDFR